LHILVYVGIKLVATCLYQACRSYLIADSLLLNGMAHYSLSKVPDSKKVAKGLLRVFPFNLKISCEIWWFLWIILKSFEIIEFAVRVLLKKTPL